MHDWRIFRRARGILALVILGVACGVVHSQDARKVAFLVGVEKYEKSGFSNLDYAEDDVSELGKALKAYGFEVTGLLGSSTGKLKATRANVQSVLEQQFLPQIAKLKKRDVVLIALAGHGQQKVVAGREDAFFCPVDAHKTLDRTWISISKLTKDVSEMSGANHNLLLIDACRDNPTRGRGVDGKNVELLRDNMGIFFAASYGQQAQEVPALRHGLFTHYVLKGLNGEAKNFDDQITWNSLVGYVTARVSREAPKYDAEQDPNYVSNLRGASPILAVPRPSSFAGTKTGQVRSDNGLSFKLVWCPSGRFTMGSPKSEEDRSDREDQVSVELTKGFWLGQTEVTQGTWRSVMGTEPWKGELYTKEGSEFAASCISWDDATSFCSKLTDRERRAGRLPKGWTYRLPTEAQWEFACRAGTTTAYSFGGDGNQLNDYGWFGGILGDGNAKDEKYAHEVGKKRANAWGLLDMHGNVFEWCRDGYAQLPGGKDPLVPVGSSRVLRGGSWSGNAGLCRSAYRGDFDPSYRRYNFGFRVVCELE